MAIPQPPNAEVIVLARPASNGSKVEEIFFVPKCVLLARCPKAKDHFDMQTAGEDKPILALNYHAIVVEAFVLYCYQGHYDHCINLMGPPLAPMVVFAQLSALAYNLEVKPLVSMCCIQLQTLVPRTSPSIEGDKDLCAASQWLFKYRLTDEGIGPAVQALLDAYIKALLAKRESEGKLLWNLRTFPTFQMIASQEVLKQRQDALKEITTTQGIERGRQRGLEGNAKGIKKARRTEGE